MFFIGQQKYGKYPDIEQLHPNTVSQYARNETPSIDDDDDQLNDAIAHDQHHHIRHEAIDPPAEGDPFIYEEAKEVFEAAMKQADVEGYVPLGFGLRPDEWEDALYPTVEEIKVAKKYVDMPLPFEIWFPRAVLWARGLEIITQISMAEDEH